MSVLPGIAHQEARVALLGFSCAEYDEGFVRAHQEPVVCGACFRMQPVPLYPRALYDEATKAHFQREARGKKKAKASKWAGFQCAPRTVEETESNG